ncbi:MAG: hypothetical protein NVS4B1_19940 [Ktedonobacteraceae bacterium]
MSDMPNTSDTPDASQSHGTPTQHSSQGLLKPPFLPGVPVQNNTPPHLQYMNINAHQQLVDGGMSPITSPEQGEFQIPPFMLADMQRAAGNFSATDPIVDFNPREGRVKVDTLQHVALASKNSVQRNVLAARPQPAVMQSAANAYGNPFTAAIQPAAIVPRGGQAAPGGPSAPAIQRQLPPHSARTKFLLLIILLGSIIPAILGIADNMSLFAITTHGYSGVQHLLHVRTLANDLKAHPTNLDINKLHQVQTELQNARDDFTILHTELTKNVYVNAASSGLPTYVSSALALSQIGVDASDIGQALAKMAIDFAPALHSSLLATSSQPLVTPAMLTEARTVIEYSLPLMKNIQAQTPSLSLDIFPISATQREQITQVIQLIPLAVTDMSQAKNLMDAMGWILGVGQPRTFLVQTMDRAELRATGGFTGQFAELSLKGGRMGPFKLQNIALFEYKDNAPNTGKTPPAVYRSWWPIANWGLRDSNLSADFPTSARIAIDTYKYEFQHQVDGVIVFSPFLISRVIAATGSIYVPEYKETITAANFESKLHYYQLDNVGIRKEELVEHVYDPDAARKLFTGRVTKLLMDKVKHAQTNDLIGIAHEMLHALKTRDLQVFVTNTQIENLLVKYDAAAVLDRSTTHDGLFVVQANVSANKGSQYVRTHMYDTVTLDANGGATHALQIHLDYHVLDQIYGPDTYHDYVRVYVPPNAKFLGGNGFEQLGQPYCSTYAGFGACPTYDAYGNGDLLCPANQSDPMVETNHNNDPYNLKNHPLNQEGPPTNMVSDEAQRAMYAGWVLIPKNCTATLTLSWYVPPTGHNAYSLLVQRQSGTYPEMDLTILPTPGNCTALKTTGKYFNTVLSRDQTFSLVAPNAEEGANTNCYVQPKL